MSVYVWVCLCVCVYADHIYVSGSLAATYTNIFSQPSGLNTYMYTDKLIEVNVVRCHFTTKHKYVVIQRVFVVIVSVNMYGVCVCACVFG